MTKSGLNAIFIANRERLLRFLAAHGAGDAAEDLLQDLWLKIEAAPPGPVGNPLSYLYRTANNLIIDRHRATTQAVKRDHAWSESVSGTAGQSDTPSSERQIIAQQQLEQVQQALDGLGQRASRIFRRHRIDGIAQKDIAAELGISLSTVESDLRLAYRTMIDLRTRFDEV